MINLKIHITWTLISTVRTIQMIVANLVDGNANSLKSRTGPLAGFARNLGSSTCVIG